MTNDYENVTEKEVAESKDNAVNGITTFVAKLKACGVTITKQAKEIEELKKRIAELEKIESDSNNEHSSCLAEIERLNKELENAKSENKELSKSLEKAKTETEKAEKTNKELTAKATKLDAENSQLKVDSLSLQSELNKYKNAISQLKFTNSQESAILKTMECYENL